MTCHISQPMKFAPPQLLEIVVSKVELNAAPSLSKVELNAALLSKVKKTCHHCPWTEIGDRREVIASRANLHVVKLNIIS